MVVFKSRVNLPIFFVHSMNIQKSLVCRVAMTKTFLRKKQHSGAACRKSGQESPEVQKGVVK